MSRNKILAVRSALHAIEFSIEKKDRSQLAEWERDLISTASLAVWDGNIRKVTSCVRRLTGSPVRREQYQALMCLMAV